MDIEDEMVDYNLAIQANHIECLIHEIDELRRNVICFLNRKGRETRSCKRMRACRMRSHRRIRSFRSCSKQ